jgi:hypothetical protein
MSSPIDECRLANASWTMHVDNPDARISADSLQETFTQVDPPHEVLEPAIQKAISAILNSEGGWRYFGPRGIFISVVFKAIKKLLKLLLGGDSHCGVTTAHIDLTTTKTIGLCGAEVLRNQRWTTALTPLLATSHMDKGEGAAASVVLYGMSHDVDIEAYSSGPDYLVA